MRVLLFVHGFPPSSLGGTEIYAHGLAQALAARGHEVRVLAREADRGRPEHAVRDTVVDGIPVTLVNNTFRACRSFAETYRGPAVREVAARVLDRWTPDVVHVHHLTCLSTELAEELERRGLPRVMTLHDYWPICHRGQLFDLEEKICPGPEIGCGPCILPHAGGGELAFRAAGVVRAAERALPGAVARPLRRNAERAAASLARPALAHLEGERRRHHMLRVLGRFDRLLSPSATLLQRYLDFGVPEDRLTRVELGLDPRPLASLSRRPRSAGKPLRIGFLGSLMVSKAPHVLLEAFAGLPDGAASLEVFGAIAPYHGDDSYRARVEPLLKAPGVHVHGPVPHDRIAEIFAAIDVLVMPSTWLENSPLVLREAFLAGVPVIASDLGGMAETVEHEVSGLLVPPGDPSSLQRALQRLVDEPELLDRLRRGAPPVRAVDEDAAWHEDLYLKLRADHRPKARPILAAVVLNFRTALDTVLAVRSLRSGDRVPDRVIVIDNGSGDGSTEVLRRQLPDVDLVETGRNFGFSGGSNLGIRRALAAGADRVLLLNGDVMVARDTVERLATALDEPGVAIAGPVILHRSAPTRIASAGMSFHRLTGRMRHLHAEAPSRDRAVPDHLPVAGVMGCTMMVAAEVFEEVGALDDDYFFSFEELDLSLRAAALGMATVTVGSAVAYHAGSRSIGADSPARLYYATRNHLLAARRAAPLPALLGLPRAALILALNLAHAVRCRWMPVGRGVAACLAGARDHLRGRYGRMPESGA